MTTNDLLFGAFPYVAIVLMSVVTVVRWRRQGFKYFWRWKSRVLSLDSKLALVFV